MTCKLCDDEKTVVASVGVTAFFTECPACVGAVRDELTYGEIRELTELCTAAGVEVKWIAPPVSPLK